MIGASYSKTEVIMKAFLTLAAICGLSLPSPDAYLFFIAARPYADMSRVGGT